MFLNFKENDNNTPPDDLNTVPHVHNRIQDGFCVDKKNYCVYITHHICASFSHIEKVPS